MLLDDKPVIDKHFQSGWTDTQIVYDGMLSDIEGKEWINIQLLPYDRELIGTAPQHGRKLDHGIIKVLCYSDSATMAYKLAKKVVDFLECAELPTPSGQPIYVEEGKPDGNGAVPLDNGIYETMINFIVKKYN